MAKYKKVSEQNLRKTMLDSLSLTPNDIGKVIGKEGRIANAIRTVVKAAAAKVEKKVTVEILTNNEE